MNIVYTHEIDKAVTTSLLHEGKIFVTDGKLSRTEIWMYVSTCINKYLFGFPDVQLTKNDNMEC